MKLTFQQVFAYFFDRLALLVPAFFVFRQDLPAAARGFALKRLVQPPRVLTRGRDNNGPRLSDGRRAGTKRRCFKRARRGMERGRRPM